MTHEFSPEFAALPRDPSAQETVGGAASPVAAPARLPLLVGVLLSSLFLLGAVRPPDCARGRLFKPPMAAVRDECYGTCLDICQTTGADLVNACACNWGSGAECGCLCSNTEGTHECSDFPGCATVYDH